ncbi:MAG: NAD-dependent protein deacylase [Pleomorphochaeta sp.]
MDSVEYLYNLLKKSSQTTVLTGAGISTLSGIKDFRSSNGIYSKEYHHLSVEDILNYDFFFKRPDIFYSWAKDTWYDMDLINPNIVHTTLTRLQNLNLVNNIFTQNIDMLHSKANSKNVYEVHGSIKTHHCTKCNKKYDYKDIINDVKNDKVPYCIECGGLIKPDIIFYGENLNSIIIDKAVESFSNSDLAIVLGSSLIVQPAASLPMYTLQNKGKLIIINRDSTPYDKYATLKLDDLKSIFSDLIEIM